MHALIIEPETLIAMTIEDALRDLGFTSFGYAATEDEAVAEAELKCPDLITADVRIEIGCGIQAVRRICSAKYIPVIYVTETGSEVTAHHPDAIVLRKPFPVRDLTEAVMQARAA